MSDKQTTSLLIIGAGPGGYTAAFLAADLGLQVTLVDLKVNPGGVCLYRGCIPSKALLHAAKLITEAKDASEIGITFSDPQIDITTLRSWKNDVIKKLTGGLGQLCKQRQVNFIQGKASFLSSRSVKIEKNDNTSLELTFEHAILATGSYPIKLPFAPQSMKVMDSTSALNITDVPHKLLIIGGGYIGLELGSVYAALGSEVTTVEMTAGILPGVDRDLAAVLAKRLERNFSALKLETKVTKIDEKDDHLEVSFEDKNGQTTVETFDKALVAIGRKPSNGDLGLENTQLQLDEKGFVKVDLQRRTADPKIYAIGDVAGNPMLAHKSSHEGRTAVEAILGHKVAFEPQAIPAVVFTDPEIAWCGLTETEARQQERDITVCKFPWAASGRAMTLNRSDGLTKLILEPETGRVLGVAIAGPGAGEMIAEGVLAVEMGALAEDVKFSIHPHPTLSETVMEAAESFFGTATHFYRPKKKP